MEYSIHRFLYNAMIVELKNLYHGNIINFSVLPDIEVWGKIPLEFRADCY